MSLDRELLQHMTPEDLPTGYAQDIARLIGVEAFVTLFEAFKSEGIYIPRKSLNPFKRRMAAQLRNRYSPKELARKLDMSEREIYRVLGEARGRHTQIGLFADEKDSADS